MTGRGGMDKIKGKAKEMTGKITGDRRKEAEGKGDQFKAEGKKAMREVHDRARGARDSLKRRHN
ncbi:CsbD family protein [Streptomyces sp. NPDC058297]|uniref:CsbD family protein n=1 Tax=Streptomyces sp. NPDC058297 TaxID=3346433 RepID=UPI0036F104AE